MSKLRLIICPNSRQFSYVRPSRLPKTQQFTLGVRCNFYGGYRVARSTSSTPNNDGRPALPLAYSTTGCRPMLSFERPEAFRDKTAMELLRGLLVLRLSSYGKFVDNSLTIMSVSQRILGQRLFEFLARCTFYGHFIAGSKDTEAKALVTRFEKAGVATILAVTAEEDVAEDKGRYDEPRYDRNTKGYMDCVNLSVSLSKKFRPVSQLKMTSFAKADVLARMTEVLTENQLHYDNDSPLSVCNLALGLDGKMVAIPELTEAENSHLRLILQRLNKISQHIVAKNVQLLVDAERTNVNPAITLVTLALMLKFNRDSPYIWNTYQCYLKQALDQVQKDLRWAQADGITFGVKIVRGAYMEAEREYAEKHQLEDPVHPTYGATCEMYNRVVNFLLDHIQKNPGGCNIIVASHNEESVCNAVNRMHKLGLDPKSGEVIFGQILGLSDHITCTLGEEGYLTYKSCPYGPVEDVLPYLARRAQENGSVFKNVQRERRLMRQELKRRIKLL